MENQHIVRRLTEDEWEVIKDMRLSMLETDPTAYDTPLPVAQAATESEWRLWAVGNANRPRSAWGAFVDGACVGMITAHREHTDCHLGVLWVHPARRGSGVAAALFAAAEEWAHKGRCTRIFLTVADWNPVQQAYSRRHYRPTGTTVPTRWGHVEVEMVKPVVP